MTAIRILKPSGASASTSHRHALAWLNGLAVPNVAGNILSWDERELDIYALSACELNQEYVRRGISWGRPYIRIRYDGASHTVARVMTTPDPIVRAHEALHKILESIWKAMMGTQCEEAWDRALASPIGSAIYLKLVRDIEQTMHLKVHPASWRKRVFPSFRTGLSAPSISLKYSAVKTVLHYVLDYPNPDSPDSLRIRAASASLLDELGPIRTICERQYIIQATEQEVLDALLRDADPTHHTTM